jgi:hypothetical protein
VLCVKAGQGQKRLNKSRVLAFYLVDGIGVLVPDKAGQDLTRLEMTEQDRTRSYRGINAIKHSAVSKKKAGQGQTRLDKTGQGIGVPHHAEGLVNPKVRVPQIPQSMYSVIHQYLFIFEHLKR